MVDHTNGLFRVDLAIVVVLEVVGGMDTARDWSVGGKFSLHLVDFVLSFRDDHFLPLERNKGNFPEGHF